MLSWLRKDHPSYSAEKHIASLEVLIRENREANLQLLRENMRLREQIELPQHTEIPKHPLAYSIDYIRKRHWVASRYCPRPFKMPLQRVTILRGSGRA